MLTYEDIDCPYCGERINLVLDTSAGAQRYIEDCQVCCRTRLCKNSFADAFQQHRAHFEQPAAQ